MSGLPAPDKDDIALFREAVGEVQPVEQDRILPPVEKPKPNPVKRQADEKAAIREMAHSWPDISETETGDELLFKRVGIQNRLLQKLRRGQFSVEAELDLHGLTVATAAGTLSDFLHWCRDAGVRCVRIVHGKGRGSKNGRPVLKNKLDRWLQQRNEVLAYCSARPVDGGTGAIYVLLKRD